ncbi:hypothetical protein PSHT_06286 [Puccinia striiformis]|uniref:Uncharacterized protein n=1 Tax=Puccinia striiformis TaxID=27350 RepID=A0A2S4W7N3_9BASI|nr:hypothetical protein PSHT_06286 [Puccinia striiformis]
MAEETTWQHQHPDHHSKTQSTSPKIIPQMPGISLEHTAPNLSTELDCLVVDRPEYRKKIVVNQEEEAGVQNMDLGANLRVDEPMDPPPAYCFQSMEDLKDFTSKWALAHEYRLPTKSSNKNKNITLHCSLNGGTPAGTTPFQSPHPRFAKQTNWMPFCYDWIRFKGCWNSPVDLCHEVPNLKVSDEGQAEVQHLCSLGMNPCVIAQNSQFLKGDL